MCAKYYVPKALSSHYNKHAHKRSLIVSLREARGNLDNFVAGVQQTCSPEEYEELGISSEAHEYVPRV
jgi:hypothetical protein